MTLGRSDEFDGMPSHLDPLTTRLFLGQIIQEEEQERIQAQLHLEQQVKDISEQVHAQLSDAQEAPDDVAKTSGEEESIDTPFKLGQPGTFKQNTAAIAEFFGVDVSLVAAAMSNKRFPHKKGLFTIDSTINMWPRKAEGTGPACVLTRGTETWSQHLRKLERTNSDRFAPVTVREDTTEAQTLDAVWFVLETSRVKNPNATISFDGEGEMTATDLEGNRVDTMLEEITLRAIPVDEYHVLNKKKKKAEISKQRSPKPKSWTDRFEKSTRSYSDSSMK
jgi:hypothetical protein